MKQWERIVIYCTVTNNTPVKHSFYSLQELLFLFGALLSNGLGKASYGLVYISFGDFRGGSGHTVRPPFG